MPVIDWTVDPAATLTEVISAINSLIPFINSMDNSQVSASAAIAATKIENGALLTAHSSRHAVGGADPLPKSSVSGAMLQPRCINSEHIGMGAILASHLASGAVLDSIAIDAAPIDYDDGDVPAAPTGYEDANTVMLITGINFEGAGIPNDTGTRDMIVFCNTGQAVVCSCKIEDSETMYKGVVSARRLSFK